MQSNAIKAGGRTRREQDPGVGLDDYLSSASFHGFQYLAGIAGRRKEKKALADVLRIVLWLSAVLAAAVAAGTIIAMNVRDWRSRPAVVTAVDEIGVRVVMASYSIRKFSNRITIRFDSN